MNYFNIQHYIHLLNHHCAADLRLLRAVHTRLLLHHSITPSNFLGSKLLSLYSRHPNDLADARNVFDRIPQPNLFAYNAMLLAYARHPSCCRHHSLSLLSSLPPSLKPDAITVSALIKNSPPPDMILALHAFSVRNGIIDSDLFVANGLISAYARIHDLTSARNLFDRMTRRDIVTWNSLISAYSQSGYHDECLHLYQLLESGADGIVPNDVTVVCALQACSHLRDLVSGIKIHNYAVEKGLEFDTVLWNSVIGFYAKCGSLEYARSLFEQMPEQDAISYNSLISGYMSYGFVEEAVDLFRKMESTVVSSWNAVIAGLVQNNRYSSVLELFRSMQDSGFRPNSVTVSSVLPAISFHSNLLGGKQVHCFAMRNDCDQNIYVATALIDTYAKAGFVEGACRVFDGIRDRSVILWTAIISAYSSHGDADAALMMFDRMLESGMRPDLVTFTAVLSACAHAGAVEEAHRVFSMMTEFKISPEIEQYACMVGVLSRAGLLKEAVKFIKNMPIEPNAKMWGSLLNGAAVFRDVELGKFAFEKLAEMEPENTGNYIVMANMYSGAGRWEEAKLTREKMTKVGLDKIPGCSWIEMSDGLQVFVARDTLNPRSEEIYIMLDALVHLMREEGYVCHEELDEENRG